MNYADAESLARRLYKIVKSKAYGRSYGFDELPASDKEELINEIIEAVKEPAEA